MGKTKGIIQIDPEHRRVGINSRVPAWLYEWLLAHNKPIGRLVEEACIAHFGLVPPPKKD